MRDHSREDLAFLEDLSHEGEEIALPAPEFSVPLLSEQRGTGMAYVGVRRLSLTFLGRTGRHL
ncbi:hypothetical protein [Streptomyces rugosispiralis]|uniref:hypothetical protein n=1 Tax=Streptomyces rugosispiralis TaxID=2967341 RepID=UPI0037049038